LQNAQPPQPGTPPSNASSPLPFPHSDDTDSFVADVTVIGNSFGGWLAADIALEHSPRVIGAVIIDGIGIEVEGHPLTDVSGVSPAEIRSYSWHDPGKAPAAPIRRTRDQAQTRRR
jgi:pimeloyl-ACP methyl ester carboxylesterase